MRVPPEKDAIRQIAERLAELTGIADPAVQVEHEVHEVGGIDAVVRVGPHTFVVEWKALSGVAPLAAAAEPVRRHVASVSLKLVPPSRWSRFHS